MNIPTNSFETLFFIIIIILVTTIISRVITKILNKFKRFKDDMTGIYIIRDIIVLL